MSIDPRSYKIALQELRTPGTYFYFQYILDTLVIVEQCKTYINILERDCKKVAHHHVSSYIKNIYQAKLDLVYHRLFIIKAFE